MLLLGEKEVIDADYTLENYEQSMKLLYELSSPASECQEEALLSLSEILERGIRTSALSDNYIVHSNLQQSIAILARLVENNCIAAYGKLFIKLYGSGLDVQYIQMSDDFIENIWANGLYEIMPFVALLVENDVIPAPSYINELNVYLKTVSELGKTPIRLLYEGEKMAKNERTKRYVFDRLQQADSLFEDDKVLHPTQGFYYSMATFLLKDKAMTDSIMSYPDSIRNYLMGIKYLNGYAVNEDRAKGDSLIKRSADMGHTDAVYAWGYHLVEKGNILEAIKYFKRIESDDRALAALSLIYRTLYKGKAYDYLNKINDNYNMYRVYHWLENEAEKELKGLPIKQAIKHIINVLGNAITYDNFTHKNMCAFFATRIAQFQTALGASPEIVEFYVALSMALDANIGYLSYLTLSDYFYFMKNYPKASEAYLEFCLHFFKQDGSTMDDNVKVRVVNKLVLQYPKLIPQVNQYIGLGYDITSISNVDKNENVTSPDYLSDMNVSPIDFLYVPYAYSHNK